MNGVNETSEVARSRNAVSRTVFRRRPAGAFEVFTVAVLLSRCVASRRRILKLFDSDSDDRDSDHKNSRDDDRNNNSNTGDPARTFLSEVTVFGVGENS
ncbi:hypothetical protein [Halorussus caseinilyticus]|uniref:Uncharacterized protein n=1 Tax=Halorussus caseinilyticus TaxID=3034025 RepID=A0ABD5WQT6_9EURY